MLTVKHIRADGTEFASEYGSYTAGPCQMSDGSRRWEYMAYQTPYAQREYSTMWAGHPTSRRPGVEELHVMNRYGATIASYYFTLPDEATEPSVDTSLGKGRRLGESLMNDASCAAQQAYG